MWKIHKFMNVVVLVCSYEDPTEEVPYPEVFLVEQGKEPGDVLRRIWEKHYNAALPNAHGFGDPLDDDECWCEESRAVITWMNGDKKEFFVAPVQAVVLPGMENPKAK